MEEILKNFKFIVLLLIIAVCGQAYAYDSAAAFVKSASPKRSIECPSRQFTEFFKAFSASSDIQEAFTKYPLKWQQLDLNADPEPKSFVKSLRRNQVEFPVIPDELERKSKLLMVRIDKMTSGHVKLTLLKDDTDYQITYFFRKNSCWKLERVEDWSL